MYNADVLYEKIYNYFKTHPLDDNGVKDVSVSVDLDPDGNPVVSVDQVRGDVFLDDKLAKLIASAVAYGVTELLNEET